MNRNEFRGYIKLPTFKMSFETNSQPSATDPSFAMSVGTFIARSSQGLPVPQYSEVSLQYGGTLEELSVLDSNHIDKFDIMLESRKENKKLSSKLKKLEKDEKQKN